MHAIVIFVILATIATSSSCSGIVAIEEAPINQSMDHYLVQYILEGDIIMVNECECSPAYECEEKNSIELINYSCGGYNMVCCVGGTKRTN